MSISFNERKPESRLSLSLNILTSYLVNKNVEWEEDVNMTYIPMYGQVTAITCKLAKKQRIKF